MLVNKTDHDLKCRLRTLVGVYNDAHPWAAGCPVPEISFNEIDDGVERVTLKGGMEVHRLLLEQNLKFAIKCYYKLKEAMA